MSRSTRHGAQDVRAKQIVARVMFFEVVLRDLCSVAFGNADHTHLMFRTVLGRPGMTAKKRTNLTAERPSAGGRARLESPTC